MVTSLLAAVALKGLLVGFLIIVIVLAMLIGLLYLIERYISPVPGIVKLILAVVLLILFAIWAAGQMGVGI